MNLKRITKILGNQDVRFNFYDELEIRNEIVYFSAISDFERKLLYDNLSNNDKSEYISNSATINLPNISEDILYERYNKFDKWAFKITLDKIRKVTTIYSNEEKLAFAAYIILHEIGHWYDFIEMGKKPYIFSEKDIMLRKKVFKERISLQESLYLKAYLTEEENKKVELYYEKYNSIPMENKANKYADMHIDDFLNKLRKYY